MTVTTCGRQVTIERAPERVMAVGSQAATLLWAAGAANKVVALTAASRPLYRATSAFDGVSKMTDEPTKEAILGLNEQRSRTAPKHTAAVVQAYPDHLAVYGQASISHVQLATLGLTNVFAEVQERTIDLNVEKLLARDPYMLVLAHSPKVTADQAMQQLRAIPGAEKLAAVREGHIIPVEDSVILGGIQPIEALDGMAATLAGFK